MKLTKETSDIFGEKTAKLFFANQDRNNLITEFIQMKAAKKQQGVGWRVQWGTFFEGPKPIPDHQVTHTHTHIFYFIAQGIF